MAEQPVRAFISYSWTSPTHESWVLQLATRLRQDGVDAILDKWDLKPGDDSFQFMEQMVTDPTVSKVLMICDRVYAEKADGRQGGVGAESQIISPELYGKGSQDKYAALITEIDDDGRAFVPTFYKGRFYLDFSSDEQFETRYEELLRWILGKPQWVKPPIGGVPAHISQPEAYNTGTESRFRRLEAAIRQGHANASGLLREFAETTLDQIELLRISDKHTGPFDEVVVDSWAKGRSHIRQLLSVVALIARFDSVGALFEEYLSLLERMAKLMFRTEIMNQWSEWDFDNFKLIAHETFVGTLAILLSEARFDLASAMIGRPYLVPEDRGNGRSTREYTVFYNNIRSLLARNQRLSLNKASLQAEMLKDVYDGQSLPSFVDFMQADFLLFLNDAARSIREKGLRQWHPVTLVYAADRYRPFELFGRAESLSYFNKIKHLIGINSPEEFRQLFDEMGKSQNYTIGTPFWPISPARLANVEHIAATG